MQFLIKSFYDSENRQSIEMDNFLLAIEDNCLIMRENSKSYNCKHFIELFRKPFNGWNNIRFNISKGEYMMDSGKYVSMQTDILTQVEGKYQLKHYNISFIPMQTYNLDKFLDYLYDINENGLSKEQSKIVESLKMQEIEAKRVEVERITQILESRLETKRVEEERIRQKEIEKQRTEQLERQNYINKINIIKEDRELEKIFINYFSKYVGKTLLHPKLFISLENNLLKNNTVYEKVKMSVPALRSIDLDCSINQYYILEQIDKMIEFMDRRFTMSNKDCAKLLTWIEICDVAISYYSNCFYEQYGKQLENIDNLNLNDSIFEYIKSGILYDGEEIRNMFVYYLMSLNKFKEVDFNRGYIYCRETFNAIYDEVKSANEYDNFINSLLVNEEKNERIYTIDDIDLMTGNEFEIFIGQLFKKMGYKTIVTKASGDQGIDVVAERNGVRYGIQAKCYTSVVSNSAIQEVVAGISFYKCDKAIVITNNYFTNSAIELAKANEVVLWDREMLKQKIRELVS